VLQGESFSANSPGKTVGSLLMSTQFSLTVRAGAQEAFQHDGFTQGRGVGGRALYGGSMSKVTRGIWSRRHRRVLVSPLDMKS